MTCVIKFVTSSTYINRFSKKLIKINAKKRLLNTQYFFFFLGIKTQYLMSNKGNTKKERNKFAQTFVSMAKTIPTAIDPSQPAQAGNISDIS